MQQLKQEVKVNQELKLNQLQQQKTKMKQESSFQRPPRSFKPEQRIPRKIKPFEFDFNIPSETKSRTVTSLGFDHNTVGKTTES
jgi:hypothetical protein